MTLKADTARRVQLRVIMFQASRESWDTGRLDDALMKLYGRSRAPRKPRQAAA